MTLINLNIAEAIRELSAAIIKISEYYEIKTWLSDRRKHKLIKQMTQTIITKTHLSERLLNLVKNRRNILDDVTRLELQMDLRSIVYAVSQVKTTVASLGGGMDLTLLSELASQSSRSMVALEQQITDIKDHNDPESLSDLADAIDTLNKAGTRLMIMLQSMEPKSIGNNNV